MASTIFHAEFTSADASAPANEAAARMAIYAEASTDAVSLGSVDNFVITDLDIRVGGTGLTVSVFDGPNTTVDAGERVLVGTFAANGGTGGRMATPFVCQAGTYPKVKTSAGGQIDVYARGYIRRQPAA